MASEGLTLDSSIPVLDKAFDIDYYASITDANVTEAHRQRPPVCGAPALIWHIAVAPTEGRDPQGASTPSDYNNRLGVWVDEINTTIERVAALDSNVSAIFLTKETRDGLLNVTRPICQFDVQWNGIKIQCIVEGHYDFVSFSFLVDLSPYRGEAGNSEILAQIFEDIKVAQSGEDNGRYPEIAHYLFDDFWMSMRAAALAKAGLSVHDNLLPGRPFAKFSGLVLEEDVAESQYSGEWDAAKLGDRFDPPGDQDHNARRIIRARWPFIIQANEGADERDIVACGMLAKRMVYVTAMGARSAQTAPSRTAAVAPQSDVRPVHYIMMVRRSPDRHQLGRVIEHINTMGTFRLMALKELSLFRQVGTSVRIYGHLIDAASEKFNDILINREDLKDKNQPLLEMDYDSAGHGPESPLKYIGDTKNIQRLQNALCQIQSKINMDAARFTGGMAFRVSRSRYYVRSMKERLPDLEISAIPPYQSYLAFVRRRLFATFDYIDDIGDRAAKLAARLSRILDAIQSKALVDLTHNIERLNKDNTDRALEEKHQTTILYTITVFAFIGQLLFAVLWAILGAAHENYASATAYSIAASTALLLFLWRRIVTEKSKDTVPDSNSNAP